MAHIEYSNIIHGAFLALSKDEAKMIIPLLRRRLVAEQRMVEKFQDILESGDASERQQTLLMQHEERVEMILGIIDGAIKMSTAKR